MYNQLSERKELMKNAIALGTFDGIHKGHLAVLNMPDSYNKIALTFEKPPKAVKTGESCLIMTFAHKSARLSDMGLHVEGIRFEEVSNIPAGVFLDIVYSKYAPALISCGFNYRFGQGGIGDTGLLRDFCRRHGIELKVAQPVIVNGSIVSSTNIRKCLKNGDISGANAALSEPFFFEGTVNHGDGRGRTLGFPTLNQRYPADFTPLRFGVYKTIVQADGREYRGITNIGKRPTYPVDYVISETYIDNFSGNLYNKNIRITPLKFLRPEIKFRDPKELKEQIEKDFKELYSEEM